MIQKESYDKNENKDVSVINQIGEKTRRKNVWAATQNTKMGKNKKGLSERITLLHTNRQKEDKQISQRGMMTKIE